LTPGTAGSDQLDFPIPVGYLSGAMPPPPCLTRQALPGRVVLGVGAVERLGEEVDRLGDPARTVDGLLDDAWRGRRPTPT
jgi:hypothetical protein